LTPSGSSPSVTDCARRKRMCLESERRLSVTTSCRSASSAGMPEALDAKRQPIDPGHRRAFGAVRRSGGPWSRVPWVRTLSYNVPFNERQPDRPDSIRAAFVRTSRQDRKSGGGEGARHCPEFGKAFCNLTSLFETRRPRTLRTGDATAKARAGE
jgi:hypothetical protein